MLLILYSRPMEVIFQPPPRIVLPGRTFFTISRFRCNFSGLGISLFDQHTASTFVLASLSTLVSNCALEYLRYSPSTSEFFVSQRRWVVERMFACPIMT